MNWLSIFLIGIILIQLLFITKILFDLKQINEQTAVKILTNSNFKIVSDLKLKEYIELCTNLNILYDKYRQAQMDEICKEKEFKEMLAYIAHDVRTPLTSVQGYLQILEEENKSVVFEEYYKIIDQRIFDIRNLLEQFFIYTKLVNHDYKIDESDCNVYAICCESLTGFYQQFVNQKIEPTIVFEQKDIIIHTNKDLLRILFDNLINNALIHGNGEILIVQKDRKLLFSNKIKVSSKIDVSKVFDRFYKVDSSRSIITSGLGLSIVKEIIQVINGSIRAEIKDETFNIIIEM